MNTLQRNGIAAAAALVIAGLGASAAQAWSLPSWMGRGSATTSTVAVATATPSHTASALPAVAGTAAPDWRAIVQRAGPAVVGITVSGLRDASMRDGPAMRPDDPFFRFFQGIPGWRMPDMGPRSEQPFRGQGSGFIVSADGLVLTNAHVVRDAQRVTVKLQDRREFDAKVLGSDPATDIAVLKIDAAGLPVVALGEAQDVQVGDRVLAIGAPYGFEQTATQGIVSAKGRSLPGDSFVPFLQTDAAVNPGNSGGPLFDAAGRVVGINAQIYSPSGGFAGLAFAIPIDVALKVRDQIVSTGKVEHARLGVMLQDLSAPLAESFGLKAPDGALVSRVAPDTAAAKAELKAGDVITAIDGQPVRVAGDLSSRIGLAKPGDQVALTVWRDKAAHDVTVRLGRADVDRATQTAAADGERLGLQVRPLDRQERREAGVDHGLVVEGVGGPAQLAGIQPGDVLLAINGQPVKGVEQVREVLAKHPKHVALLVSRDGQQIFVPVDIG
ncbi:DegQ family serine endoprotease [Rubrivivax albus]|uniref:DegQ family serine endoprotease n=1 Tax=Rubrivivax albus TaxID=2499835 RepID=A0A3S2TM20_9BURK|nr:DegQ family serine endoprotease [Rubrivivax albus]RVT50842.1 DegQ family serine endoprotease [Rubrivivax albus]